MSVLDKSQWKMHYQTVQCCSWSVQKFYYNQHGDIRVPQLEDFNIFFFLIVKDFQNSFRIYLGFGNFEVEKIETYERNRKWKEKTI